MVIRSFYYFKRFALQSLQGGGHHYQKPVNGHIISLSFGDIKAKIIFTTYKDFYIAS